MEQLSERLFDFFAAIPKRLYLPIGLSVGGLMLLCIGLIQLSNFQAKNASLENSAVSTQSVQAASVSAGTAGIHVDIEGAVVRPGVYVVPQGSRIQDVLVAAGGMSAIADRELIAKTVNLAAKVVDGGKVYMPRVGETNSGTSQGTPYAGVQVHLIDLNSATADELDSLPGVGPVTAQKIIDNRPYESVSDLQTKKIVSTGVYEKIKNQVTVY